ncbi:MAG: hypothetical protein AAF551_07510, partial [Bacteroidota bacterium]
ALAKAEQERLALERQEAEALAKAEQERIAKAQAEEVARAKAERERLAQEQAAAKEQAEKDRIAKEQAAAEARAKAERERLYQEQLAALAKAKAEQERIAKEQKDAATKAEQERLAREQERKRLTAEQAEKFRLEQEERKKRTAELNAENTRLAREAEQNRLTQEAEKRQLAQEAYQKELQAQQEEIAEQNRLAVEEARQKQLAYEANQKQLAEEAERKRKQREEALAQSQAEQQLVDEPADDPEPQQLIAKDTTKTISIPNQDVNALAVHQSKEEREAIENRKRLNKEPTQGLKVVGLANAQNDQNTSGFENSDRYNDSDQSNKPGDRQTDGPSGNTANTINPQVSNNPVNQERIEQSLATVESSGFANSPDYSETRSALENKKNSENVDDNRITSEAEFEKDIFDAVSPTVLEFSAVDINDLNYDTTETKILSQKVLKTKGNSFSRYVSPTQDGGVIMTGEAEVNGEMDIFLMKLDPDHQIEWSINMGTKGNPAGKCVKQAANGDYVLTGEANGDIVLIRTDSKGNIKWANSFGGPYEDVGKNLTFKENGNIVINGYITNTNGWDVDSYQIETNGNGKKINSVIKSGQDPMVQNEFQSNAELKHRRFRILSDNIVYFKGVPTSKYRIQLDPYNNGDVINIVGEPNRDIGNAVIPDGSNFYIISSDDAQANVSLYYVNNFGQTYWKKTLGGGKVESGRSVSKGGKNEFSVIGNTSEYSNGKSDIYITRIQHKDSDQKETDQKQPVAEGN